ncbi:putative bacterial alpha-l-rhamnosidase domain protein [Diaporthe ampelina]|uniref:Putative bacterial alpha-l-rhamnosidase domain protein n=1 Tax=Diaporthe ampelina TaxID=1214573 RepID=A0A0G2HRE3_9PEZI|nr:putative bacterial alpha-l-rhamnosidase domain protein [Diaporthe ampelina]
MEPFTRRAKGNRTDFEKGVLYGMTDTYTLQKGSNYYSPFWFRTFRYIRLTITTPVSNAPVSINSFTYRSAHYPLQVRTEIQTSDALTRKLWDISVNTLRNCMHETYEDCPFYEQNQFAMDTRSMILFTYLLSRDDRLARKAMQEFYATRREDGLIETHSPCPGRSTNIPTFSLFWVLMVWDHMVHFGDEVLVRNYLGTVDGVLNFFHERINPDTGLVGQFDQDTWAFVDWVDGWATPSKGFWGLAVPPAYHKTGSATYHSLVYAYVLSKAGELCRFIGRHDTSREYVGRRNKLIQAVKAHCFDEETGFFLDGPGTHGEIKREEHGLVKASFALGFYVFRAVSLAEVYEECWSTLIQPWEKMVADNLTTWAESESMTRSDCHGWSATPLMVKMGETKLS